VNNEANVIENINSDFDVNSVWYLFYNFHSSGMSESTYNSVITDRSLGERDVFLGRDSNSKKDYKEFVKLVLKIKFEKLHNTHNGQKINEKTLYKECLSKNIQREYWASFIEEELQYIDKYIQPKSEMLKKKSVLLIK